MSEYGYGTITYGGIRYAWPDWVFTDAVSGQIDVGSSVADSGIEADGSNGQATVDGSIGTADLVFDGVSTGVDVFGSVSKPDIEGDADSGVVNVLASVGTTELVQTPDSGGVDVDGAIARSNIELAAVSGDADVLGNAVAVVIEHNATSGAVDVDGAAVDLSDLASVINADGVNGTVRVGGSSSSTNWEAYIGGTILTESGQAFDGVEVHIIRDNDDTLVASTTTDSNGEWSVVLPAGNDPRPDPPVYSIEVWHREGAKRDYTACIFNAKNRPYIDTADPSETNPYDEFYYNTDP